MEKRGGRRVGVFTLESAWAAAAGMVASARPFSSVRRYLLLSATQVQMLATRWVSER